MTNGNDAATALSYNESDEFRNKLIIRPGLTKREYLAAMAMQGLISCPNVIETYSVYSEMAVKHADALITELNKTKQDEHSK